MKVSTQVAKEMKLNRERSVKRLMKGIVGNRPASQDERLRRAWVREDRRLREIERRA